MNLHPLVVQDDEAVQREEFSTEVDFMQFPKERCADGRIGHDGSKIDGKTLEVDNGVLLVRLHVGDFVKERTDIISCLEVTFAFISKRVRLLSYMIKLVVNDRTRSHS